MKVIVIGGGPSGMIAAIRAAENKHEVVILEKMKTLGRKLLITGKGRCNVTSSLDIDEFIKNTPTNGSFLFSAYKQYTNNDVKEFMEKQGLELKEERGNRYFPVTDKSQDVLKCFTKRMKDLNVKVECEARVTEIILNESKEQAIGVVVNNKKIYADKIIVATGGKSYPLTGSTGEGYTMLKKVGHTIQEIRGSLVPFEIYEKDVYKNLQGLSLKNVKIEVIDKVNNKKIYEDFGEMIFTHFGISGPMVLSMSSCLVRYKNIDEKLKNKQIAFNIDFKPALTIEVLDKRILRDFEELKNKNFKNSLDKLLPQKLIGQIVELVEIDENKKVNEITKEERKKLTKILKNFELTLKKFRPVEEAIITNGGVKIKEINPKTMESKIIKSLYIAGEIIDVDSYTGGFNLQIAYSTGYVAGSLGE